MLACAGATVVVKNMANEENRNEENRRYHCQAEKVQGFLILRS
jgi:hypothetical protein